MLVTIPRQYDFPAYTQTVPYGQTDFPTNPGDMQYGFAEGDDDTQRVIDLGGIDTVLTAEPIAKGYVLWLERDELI